MLSSLIGRHALIRETVSTNDDILPTVSYGAASASKQHRVLQIQPDEIFWASVLAGSDITPRDKLDWRGVIYPLWSRSAGGHTRDSATSLDVCPVDPIAAAFFLVSRIEEWRSDSRDRHGRFPAQDAWMVKEGLIERPLVHEYAAGIAATLGMFDPFESVRTAWLAGRRFAIGFTHDVDRVRMHGPLWQDLRRAAGALRFPGGLKSAVARLRSRRIVRSGRKSDPYDTFDSLANGHHQHGNKATFFWINTTPSVRNSDYRCTEPSASGLIRSLASQGFEIGIHGSYGSFEKPSLIQAEKSGLEALTGKRVDAIRQHYLRFRPGLSWPSQIAAGLQIDSSLGFAARMGFRAGLAVPFRPWDFAANRPYEIWEVPLVMMDGTAREYMKLSPEQAIPLSRQILNRVATVGGGAAVLWHNSSFDKVDWPGWDRVYNDWLDATSEFGGWGGGLSEIVAAWDRYLCSLSSNT